MTQMSFDLVTFILPSHQVTGHSWDKMFSFSMERRLHICADKLGGKGAQGSRDKGKPIPKLEGSSGLPVCASGKRMRGWETKGEGKTPSPASPGGGGLASGSYRHLPPTPLRCYTRPAGPADAAVPPGVPVFSVPRPVAYVTSSAWMPSIPPFCAMKSIL